MGTRGYKRTVLVYQVRYKKKNGQTTKFFLADYNWIRVNNVAKLRPSDITGYI